MSGDLEVFGTANILVSHVLSSLVLVSGGIEGLTLFPAVHEQVLDDPVSRSV
jgi:hypothetical protein